jgi:putative FmdB family regulatory protein
VEGLLIIYLLAHIATKYIGGYNMPWYELECKDCGFETEVITTRISEKLPKCEKCGGKYKKLISPGTWRWALSEGVWDTVDGQPKYLGKGGPKRTLGGEQMDVHEGMPVQKDKPPTDEKIKDDDDGEVLDEIDVSTIPEGVDH